jgi:signal-transduction protein with cAMP-binding, CBS, and nucleotidyltransferase domain
MPIDRLIRRPARTLGADASCVEAAAMMRDDQIGAVVVTDDDRRVLGIVTDRDLAVRVIAAGLDPRRVALREVMSGEPIYLSRTRNVAQLLATMRDLAVRRVPVVDDGGRVLGLISFDDVLVLLADQLEDLAEVIRKEIGPAL